MSFPQDLLSQARSLLRREPRRPKQASLRRAVSAAYYALFHLLTEETVVMLLGRNQTKPFRSIARRSFGHSAMKRWCNQIRGGSLPENLAEKTGLKSVPPELATVAGAFVMLQEARHRADYDMDAQANFTRREAGDLVRQAEQALNAWQQIRNTPEAGLFVTLLAFPARP